MRLVVSVRELKARKRQPYPQTKRAAHTGWVIAENGKRYPIPRQAMRNLTRPMGSPEDSSCSPSVVMTAAYGEETSDDFRCMVRLSVLAPRWRTDESLRLMLAVAAAAQPLLCVVWKTADVGRVHPRRIENAQMLPLGYSAHANFFLMLGASAYTLLSNENYFSATTALRSEVLPLSLPRPSSMFVMTPYTRPIG